MATATRLRKIKCARNCCISDIQSLLTLATRVKDDTTLKSFFKARYEDIDEIRDNFMDNHQKYIEQLLANEAEANIEIEDTIREGFLSDFYAVKALHIEMNELDGNLSLPQMVNSTAITSPSPGPHVRLPKLEIPKFKGDFKDFAPFLDLYNALVHNHPTLTDIEKFNYLMTVLEGQPLSLVRNLPLTANNYLIAYDTLVKRYLNKRLRAQGHWQALEGTQKLNPENPVALRSLLDTFSENLSALKVLGFPVESWDFVLVMMIIKRLDNSILTKFEIEHGSNEVPTFAFLINFLEKICVAFDTFNYSFVVRKKPQSLSRPHTGSYFVSNSTIKCPLCKEGHALYRCAKFLQQTPYERFNFCKGLHLCFNCLSDIHDLRNCQSLVTCKTCNQRHHTLLHFSSNNSQNFKNQNSSRFVNTPNHLRKSHAESPPAGPTLRISTNADPHSSLTVTPAIGSQFSALVNSNKVFSATENTSNAGVLLATAIIHIKDHYGTFQPFRCLLDSGSMTSFITLKAANRLGLPKNKCTLEINGIGSMQSKAQHGSVTLVIKPVDQETHILTTDAVILNKICDNLPSMACSPHNWSHIRNLKLADDKFYNPSKVDVLLGSDIFPKILLNGHISGAINEPDAVNTIFGYILLGRFITPKVPQLFSFLCHAREASLEDTLKKYWEVETVPYVNCISPDDAFTEAHFAENYSRDSTGRYEVSLPFRDNVLPEFSGSRELAINRFLSLEKRLLKQPTIYSQYKDFMQDYLNSNHMEFVNNIDASQNIYYLPHHCVLKPESQTTKLRVVFNASAKLPNQTSLNDHLLIGPKLQKDIVSILLNFRIFKYVLCADIKQMYRMININPSHCDYQRIIFRFSPDEPLQDYRLKTVTYGLSSAPFLALRTLVQLVADEGSKFPLASNAINNSTYIDDITTGCFNLDEAKQLQNQLIGLLDKGGFQLRKWASNEPTLLSNLNPEHLSYNPRSFDLESDDATLKVLGLKWNPVSDTFLFSVNSLDRPCTKRNMLSELARMFDPLGFLSPISLFNKIMIQRLWTMSLDWDEEPPDDLIRLWTHYKADLPLLVNLQVPRQLFTNIENACELHGFCDASEKGYAAVVYVRIVTSGDSMSTKFVCAKTKVAPLTKLTIPRLELCAAVLLANLVTLVMKPFKQYITFRNIFAWTDSQIVLCWLKASAHRWKTFVSNRVAYIQERIPSSSWYHVRSQNNPADLASRGCLPAELLSNTLWFNGPNFLSILENSTADEELSNFSHPAISEETKKIVLFNIPMQENFMETLLNAFSSFNTLQRVLAYLLRFTKNLKNKINKCDKISGPLTSQELHDSLLILIKYTQQNAFDNEINRKHFSKPLQKLNVFVDNSAILRIGGRLKFANLRYDAKHPFLLPRKSRLTSLLIDYYHKRYLHAGPRTLLFLLSQKFWILSPRRAINSVLSKCLTCWRINPTNYEPPMSDLPRSRLLQTKCFLNSGVDYAGPYSITLSRHRGVKTCKAYICLFVCLSTKAIHLELASDMTSATFLSALQRFIARRGRCQNLYSDQGTNFVGAYREIQTFMQHAATLERIEWHFNPPSSPHFGGLWEAGVKAVKTHLTRVIGQQVLTYEEFYTVLTLTESVLNSRPLTAMSADPEDISALTPGHFLTLEPLSPLPTPDTTGIPLNRLSRWQLLQSLHRDFWSRWHKEYLHSLQQRSKWLTNITTPNVGTLVLIKTDNAPPNQWTLARIVSFNPGADGVARVATVKTKNGTLLRPLVKLCPLPLD